MWKFITNDTLFTLCHSAFLGPCIQTFYLAPEELALCIELADSKCYNSNQHFRVLLDWTPVGSL